MKKMKCAAEDYTETDLPATRKDVFCECYRERFRLLFRIGLMCFVVLIPVIIISFMRDYYVVVTVSGLKEPTTEDIAKVYYTADMVYGLYQIAAQTLFAVLFAGVMQILRQTLWNEPVFFGDDFRRGIKSNALNCGVAALLLAASNYLLSMFSASVIKYLLYGVLLFMVLPVAIWFALHGVYYKLGAGSAIKNAVLLYVRTVPYTLVLIICTVAPFWLVMNLITLLLAKYIVFVVLALFYVVPLTMCWMLYASHIFDKYINKENYPEIYRKGMRKGDGEESQTQDMRSLY